MLLQQFKNILSNADVDSHDAEMEWTLLKKEIHMQDLEKKILTGHPFTGDMSHNSQYPGCDGSHSTIAQFTAQVERGFSQLKFLKARLRSQLSQQTLTAAQQYKCCQMIYIYNILTRMQLSNIGMNLPPSEGGVL